MRSTRRLRPALNRASVPCLLLAIAAGCQDTRNLISLETALDREFVATTVSVSLTDGILLTMTVMDSVLVLAPCDAQVGFAIRVARFVSDHYTGFDELQSVNVAFSPGQSHVVVPTHQARLPVRFSPAAVRAGLGTADSTAAVSACTAYEELQ